MLEQIVDAIDGFSSLKPVDMIRFFAWFLHVHEGKEHFQTADIGRCFDLVHVHRPSGTSQLLSQLAGQKDLIKTGAGYKLAKSLRDKFDAVHGGHRRIADVSKILLDLPAKVPHVAVKAFLDETLICYRNGAFRATIVMAWNLAYDHLLEWILRDTTRLAGFNARIPIRFANDKKKIGLVIKGRTDFEDLKESEVIALVSSAGLCSSNITRILDEKLTKRNMAAHPSLTTITQHQAEDVVTDLVNNVVLALI